MSSFVVSARKYRPVRFDEVVGQQHVTQTLKNALRSDHLAHAFLFCGPRGVGKTTCARILAKVLNCTQVTDDFEPCNTCPSCKSFNENASFNILELDAASNNSVDHMRTLVEQVRFQPQQGKYKVFIIDEVHMLSASAFNAFLKTLEEPPPYAIFILATTEKHKILPTILSRCQIFDFKRIQVGHIIDHLKGICERESIEAETDALHIIAQKADGALRDALSIFDRIVSFSGGAIRYGDVIENLNVLDYDFYFQVVDALLAGDGSQAMIIFNDILRKGFEGDIFINGLSEHLRDLLVCKDEQTLPLLELSETLQARYREQSRLADLSFLLTALNLANECDIHYKQTRNKRLHVELCLLKMAHVVQLVHAPGKSQENQASAQTEKKTPDLSEDSPTPPTGKAEEPQAEATEDKSPGENGKATLPGLTGSDVPGLAMEDLLKEARQEDAARQNAEVAKVNLESLTNVWQAFVEEHKSDATRTSLKQVVIDLKEGEIVARVGSKIVEETLRNERDMLEYLRSELSAPNLSMRIVRDASLVKEPPKVRKNLTDLEKFQKLHEQNPLVKEMQERFNLRFDRD